MPDPAPLPLPAPLPAPLAPYLAPARRYAAASHADNTRRAYRADWRDFERFCAAHDAPCLPAAPETVALYATALADSRHLAANTIARRLSALREAHHAAGFPAPTAAPLVRTVLAGIRRLHGTAATGKTPLPPVLLRQLCAEPPAGLRDRRDRALLLVGFAGALRRSELVALTCADLAFVPEGLVLTIRRSKTDPDGAGSTIGIPAGADPATCPVRALRAWLEAARITAGPVFRAVDRWTGLAPRALEAHRVARIVKRLAERSGLDPAHFSAHSLRSGLATAAAAGGASERALMDQTRHRSLPQLRRYIRRASLFHDNAAAQCGL